MRQGIYAPVFRGSRVAGGGSIDRYTRVYELFLLHKRDGIHLIMIGSYRLCLRIKCLKRSIGYIFHLCFTFCPSLIYSRSDTPPNDIEFLSFATHRTTKKALRRFLRRRCSYNTVGQSPPPHLSVPGQAPPFDDGWIRLFRPIPSFDTN